MTNRSPRRARPGLEACEARAPLSQWAPTPAAPPVTAAVATTPTPTPIPIPTPARAPFNTRAFPSERAKLTRRDYPFLAPNYEVLAPSSDRYNCIAHALGRHDRWITPQTGPKSNPFAWLDRVAAAAGFRRTPGLDTALVAGVTKLVVYAYTDRAGRVTNLTHVAKQSPDGTWTSKLGHWALIRHATPEAVSGPLYGKPVAVYARVGV